MANYPYEGFLSEAAFATSALFNGFIIFGTRTKILDNELDGFSVGFVENLNTYRD